VENGHTWPTPGLQNAGKFLSDAHLAEVADDDVAELRGAGP
jgi:hypothetical protein